LRLVTVCLFIIETIGDGKKVADEGWLGDCSILTPSELRWTKISQDAVISPGYWVTDRLIENNFTTSTVLPRNLAPGNYVIRHEIVALHSAYGDNGAQLYPQCLNLRVGGKGSVKPTSGVEGTKLYKRDDKGLIFDIYSKPTTYPFPGPEVWTGAN
jgi:cellulase